MKIAMLSLELGRPCGGVGNHVYHLSQELASEHEIYIIAPGEREFESDNIFQVSTPNFKDVTLNYSSYYLESFKKAL
ncbi:MAG: hypothetical protein ABEJ72_01680 [Candidatus Aenigmatarchaeota archaeon]